MIGDKVLYKWNFILSPANEFQSVYLLGILSNHNTSDDFWMQTT